MSNFSRTTVPETSQRITRRYRVILGVTGSVAAVKSPLVALDILKEVDAEVIVLLTTSGHMFWTKAKAYDPCSWAEFLKHKRKLGTEVNFPPPENEITVYEPQDEWNRWHRIGDPVLHIDLRNWADIMVIAPLSANTLAKVALGMCDDPLTCCIRAWDFGHGDRLGKPLVLAPAMNTGMWQHPLTQCHLQTIKSFWNSSKGVNQIMIIEPKVESTLACGERGTGAMAEVHHIVEGVKKLLKEQ